MIEPKRSQEGVSWSGATNTDSTTGLNAMMNSSPGNA